MSEATRRARLRTRSYPPLLSKAGASRAIPTCGPAVARADAGPLVVQIEAVLRPQPVVHILQDPGFRG